MNNDWKPTSLSEILTLERRPVKLDPEKEYAEIGMYSYGRGIFHKQPRTGFEVGDKDLFLIKNSDFIFQITFAWEGAVGLASELEDGMYGSVRFPTYRVNEDICYPKFLVNYFKTYDGRNQLVNISPGSAGRNRVLSTKRLPEILVPLPPLEEQRLIVEHIEALANRIEKVQSLREDASEEANLLVQQSIWKIFSDGEKENKYVRRLGDICEFQGGSQPPKSFFAYEPQDGYIRLIQIRDYKSDNYRTYVPNDSVTRFCSAEDIMIGRYGPPVFQILRGIDGAYNVAIMKTVPDETVLSKPFLYYLLQEPIFHKKVVDDSQRSSGQTGIRKELLQDHMTYVPPLDEQRRIVAYLDSVQARLASLRELQSATGEELSALLPSVLDRAFKGEL